MPDRGAVTRVDLCEAVHGAIGLPKAECARLVGDVLGEICDALGDGETVKLSGFGTFLLRDKTPRTGRNPKSGEPVPITARRVLTFRAAQSVRARIAGAGDSFAGGDGPRADDSGAKDDNDDESHALERADNAG